MLVVATVVGRALDLRAFGVFGLLSSLAGYLLVIQNAAAAAVVRELAVVDADGAGSDGGARRSLVATSALALYVAAALAAAALVAAAGWAIAAALRLPPGLERQAELGALALAVAVALGWPLTLLRDVVRARGRFMLLAGCELAGLAAYGALVCALAAAGAPLWAVVGANGTLPLAVGLAAAASRPLRGWARLRPAFLRIDTARRLATGGAQLSAAEITSAVVYTADRALLGALASPRAVGLFEGPLRAHNVLRALGAAFVTTVLPAAARLRAAGDSAALRELAVRGMRYALLSTAPLAAAGAVSARPLLELWLGARYGGGAPALAVLLSYWLVYAAGMVGAALLVASGGATRVLRAALATVAANLVLAAGLAPSAGATGVAVAIALPAAVQGVWLARAGLQAVGGLPRRFTRAVVAPGWVAAAVAAAGAFGAQRTLAGGGPLALAAAAAAVVAGWLVAFVAVLDHSERQLLRALWRRA